MSFDITFCTNKECPKMLKCRRNIIHIPASVPTRWLSMSEFFPTGDDCKFFWNIDKEEKK